MHFKTCVFLLVGTLAGITLADPTAVPTPKAQEANPKPAETATEADSLEAAYRREYAFLDTQRRQLQQLLEEFQRSAAIQERQLEGKIAALERQALHLSLEVKRREDALLEAEKRNEAAQEQAALLEMTLTQAKTSLEDHGLKVDASTASAAEQLNQLFQLAQQALHLGSTLHRQPASFFLPDGQEVQGTILFLGNIAAYGISGQGSGMLLPAGEGRLKLLDQPKGMAVAKALIAGQAVPVLPLFLFENVKQSVELEQAKTWRQVLDDGGPIAWIIAGLGGLGLLLALTRTGILTGSEWGGKGLTRRVVALVASGAREAAQNHLERVRSAYAPVLKASLSHLDLTQEEWEIAVSDALLQQAVRLDRFSSLVLVIAAVAPLLGLLGTVTGMIETFDVITRFGTGDPKLLASGIAVALITTEVGLIVAIPLLLVGNLLNGWAANLKTDLELAALAVREARQDAVVAWSAEAAEEAIGQPPPLAARG